MRRALKNEEYFASHRLVTIELGPKSAPHFSVRAFGYQARRHARASELPIVIFQNGQLPQS
jgi:hypothetical protein